VEWEEEGKNNVDTKVVGRVICDGKISITQHHDNDGELVTMCIFQLIALRSSSSSHYFFMLQL
jgi:hypothetical protein